jgi:2-polyprenyl-3-methyl-5-hydroxy-6-metoxy-1,4-benzoquinol methylase
MAYDSVNPAVLAAVPSKVRKVLDLGCGGGSLGAKLRDRFSCAVTGVTFDPEEAAVARERLDNVILGDLNSMSLDSLGRFDCIICCHVLEHLNCPMDVLKRVKNCIEPEGHLIVALPNVLHWKQRLMFLRGTFRYTNGGLMDATHYRFFDWWTARELVREAGFDITAAHADGNLPLSRLLRFGKSLDQIALRRFPGLFGWQFVIVAAPLTMH